MPFIMYRNCQSLFKASYYIKLIVLGENKYIISHYILFIQFFKYKYIFIIWYFSYFFHTKLSIILSYDKKCNLPSCIEVINLFLMISILENVRSSQQLVIIMTRYMHNATEKFVKVV